MWCGHTLEHLFADGWSTASHKRKMTLLEAPTGTFLWQRYEARHCALVTVIWFVEEVGDHHGKETGLKYDFDSIRKKWTFGSGSLLCQRVRRRRDETAWKRRRIQTSLVIVIITLHVLTYVISYKKNWIWVGVVKFWSHEGWFDRGYVIWLFLNHCLEHFASLR